MIRSLIVVGLGSFVGGGLRFLLSGLAKQYIHHPFPLGTFVVNILGCLAIGLFYGCFERGHILHPDLRLFLTVGVCGGFTTFSSFALETGGLIKDGNGYISLLYAGLSVVCGLIAVFAGESIRI